MFSATHYESIIGLEIHAQLLTESKAFCSCPSSFGDLPNSNVCPVCLGLPGVLPVLNTNVVEFVLRMGLATHCTIAERSVFARKNYFYPDLPKGYQISQYETPICSKGFVEIELDDGRKKQIGITRIHMEEDAGKSIHDLGFETLVDLNRCGVPLIEIVTEPDIRSPREASITMQTIRQIVTYLGICDGNMEEGSLRCDANVSVRPVGDEGFGTKTEIKNLNSFRFVEKALEYEIERQIRTLERGERVVQETLLWNPSEGVATPMRSKEEAHDYRYFPEPDLVPVVVGSEWVEQVRRSLPEFPAQRRARLIKEFGLPAYDAEVLTTEKELADFFETTVRHLGRQDAESWKIASNWVMTEILRVVKERHVTLREIPVSAERLARLVNMILKGSISGTIAKEVFEEMLVSKDDPAEIVERRGLLQVSDESAIESVIDDVLARNKSQVQEFLNGKQKVFGFLVGETMKAMKGRGNPKIVNEVLRRKLEKAHS